MKELVTAKNLLFSGNYTCVIVKGDYVFTSTLRGVRPIVEWLDNNSERDDFRVADKVVGKATAFLYAIMGATHLYAGVISKSALALLTGRGVTVEYGTLVENIINRSGDGICPFEEAVLGCNDYSEAHKIIKEKLRAMSVK